VAARRWEDVEGEWNRKGGSRRELMLFGGGVRVTEL
jgi:hypothetical protein